MRKGDLSASHPPPYVLVPTYYTYELHWLISQRRLTAVVLIIDYPRLYFVICWVHVFHGHSPPPLPPPNAVASKCRLAVIAVIVYYVFNLICTSAYILIPYNTALPLLVGIRHFRTLLLLHVHKDHNTRAAECEYCCCTYDIIEVWIRSGRNTTAVDLPQILIVSSYFGLVIFVQVSQRRPISDVSSRRWYAVGVGTRAVVCTYHSSMAPYITYVG